METTSQTFHCIYSIWPPKAGYRIADSYDFEYYDEWFKPDSKDSEMDIYIPV